MDENREIELKLSIHPEDVAALFRHPLIDQFSDGPPVERNLVSHYFDTPDRRLRRSAMALRIRSDGKGFVQTLKKRGTSLDGLTVRGEWEWPVEGLSLRGDLMEGLLPPEVTSSMESLGEVFRTDFCRILWTLRIPGGNSAGIGGPLVVEMVLDRGEVRLCKGDSGREEILEVELEILEGNPDLLYGISDRLKETLRVSPWDISKAQRGYRLLDGA